MLSPRDDDDDDNHLCIKCNTTIVGLENYIKHRKERCVKKLETKSDLPTIDPLEPTYSLGADVFFQSLELQSSVKKTSLSRLTPPIPISKPSLERKGALTLPSTSRDIPRMSPLETNLRGEDWIGGHSLRIGSNEDNQTKLINAVASISGAVKKDIPTSSYNMSFNDFKGDDDSDESEESEEEDDDEIHPTGGKWKPPPNYTGGKWRPASPEHEEWDDREIHEHTGGKWKPLFTVSNEREDDYDAPPPGHTKGKWVPGAHEKTQIMQTTIQRKGAVQYWCGPCNRRLRSRAIYEKHLMSSLHMRKVLPEHELEFSGHLDPINITEKRTTRPSRFKNNSIYTQTKRKKYRSMVKLKLNLEKKKRKRKPFFIQCSGCKSRVRSQLMGKHLISHYHFRKATETQSPNYKELILQNITAIVHQSPFQCSPCKFYTNWLSNFMQHWFSAEHELKMNSIDGRYWCSFCKFECETSQQMLQHMAGLEHGEVIAVINRSMPIIIRKKTVIRCDTCFQEFRFNMEIKRHCIKTGHQLCYSATDDYQEIHKCQHCAARFKSSLTLAAHLKTRHKQKAYLCLVCSRSFHSAEEAKRHRYTSEHRIKRKENLKSRGQPVKDLSKKCSYCKKVLENIIELKAHIGKVHPEKKRKCPTCGMAFILSQEVTRHVRSKACQFLQTPLNASILWHCSQCPFATDSQAECFFHEVLHSSPVQEVYQTDDKEKIVEKYSCPLCPKAFSKASLRRHLRQHTFERPHVCEICGANFTRQASLDNHIKLEHSLGTSRLPKIPETIEKKVKEEFVCGRCKKGFASKTSLSRHNPTCPAIEQRRCPHEECAYVATTPAQLARHRRSHGERVKHHECPHCDFKTDQASHMKRHLLCHQGVKPYRCPHCEFTCGSLENLRKHVLRSGRHPGKFLYKCKSCDYQTNLASDLRNHLTDTHANQYDAKTALEAVKRHLMLVGQTTQT